MCTFIEYEWMEISCVMSKIDKRCKNTLKRLLLRSDSFEW